MRLVIQSFAYTFATKKGVVKIKSLQNPFSMNTELLVMDSNEVHAVCFILINFVSVLVVLKAETAFSVLLLLRMILM